MIDQVLKNLEALAKEPKGHRGGKPKSATTQSPAFKAVWDGKERG